MGNLLAIISPGSIVGIVDTILNTIIGLYVGPLVWSLCDIFFLVLHVFEKIYKMFAGIDPIKINGEVVNQDPVLYLLNTRVVQEMFFSVLILSFILLVIFTIFAITKNIYTDKPKPVGEILSSSIKAMLMYLLVPVATIVCLIVGNVVLIAIDGATKTPGVASMSDQLFLSAAYNANKLRGGADWEKTALLWSLNTAGALNPKEEYKDTFEYQNYVATMAKHGIEVNKFGAETFNVTDWEEVASAIDKAYVNGIIGVLPGPTAKFIHYQVMIYYDILEINFIMVWAGGAFMIGALGKITWGLISRMFKMTAYFVISPALMATFPIDGGKALGNWRGEMVKAGTMALCSVGTINIVLAILPAFANVKVFNNFILDGIVTLMLDIVAICGAEKLISTVSSWFGTGDALAEGNAVKNDVKTKTQGTMKKVGGMVAATKGGFDAAIKHGGNGFVGAMSGFLSQTSVGKTWSDTQKLFKDAGDAGANQYKDVATRSIRRFGGVDEDKVAEYEAAENREKLAKEFKSKFGDSFVFDPVHNKDLKTKKAGESLRSQSDAGKILLEDKYNELEAEKKANEKATANAQIVSNMAVTVNKEADAQDALTKELEHIFGTGRENIKDEWIESLLRGDGLKGVAVDSEADVAAVYHAQEMFTNRDGSMNASIAGTIANRLQGMIDTRDEAVAAREAANKEYQIRMLDSDFKKYIDEHGGIAAIARAEEFAKEIAEKAEELRTREKGLNQQEAMINYREMQGRLTQDEKDTVNKRRSSSSKK